MNRILKRATTISKAVRPLDEKSCYSNKQVKEEEQALKEIHEFLPDYPCYDLHYTDESLRRSAHNFVRDLMDGVYGPAPHKDPFIKAVEIKAPYYGRQVVWELSGYNLFSSFELKRSLIPTIYTVAKTEIFSHHFFLYSMNLIQGKTLSNFLYDFFSEVRSQEERKSVLKTAVSLAKAVGAIIGEIHAIKQEKALSFSESSMMRKFKIDFEIASAEIIRCFSDISLEALEKRYFALLEKASTSPFLSTYVHGDFDCKNIIFREDNNQFTLIDFAASHKGISRSEKPMGLPAYDISLMLFDFNRLFTISLLDHRDFSSVRDAFFSGYLLEMSVLPPEEHLDFFNFYATFTRIAEAIKRKTEHQNDMKEFITTYKSFIKNLI